MLQVNAIDLHYGAAQALRGISLKAELGQVTCVLGRNGVGKTSLLRALVGQHPISKGSITWEGDDLTALKPFQRARRGIAYVPQGR
jgi:urea transport system ATP-binding protein